MTPVFHAFTAVGRTLTLTTPKNRVGVLPSPKHANAGVRVKSLNRLGAFDTCKASYGVVLPGPAPTGQDAQLAFCFVNFVKFVKRMDLVMPPGFCCGI